ncbi:MAG: ribonuclease Y [candidate division KSB1 bacterium]|nr:ribonuclease Y [candidate division KSB1 bacterium]
MMTVLWIVLLVASSGVSFLAGWVVRKRISQRKVASAELIAERIVSEAQKEAEALKREKLLEAREEYLRLKQSVENEFRNQRIELQKLERQLQQKETNLDRRAEMLDEKLRALDRQQEALRVKEEQLAERERELQRMLEQQKAALERISGISQEEAKQLLMESMKEKARKEAAQIIKEIKDQAKLTANKEAKEIIIQAIQRSAADHSVETTVSVVNLPNEEMKGRIIGREGRNIRAFEQATGVDVIVDDTPEAVILSAFDPFRREVARVALERLIADGRIHPTRIEEVVEKTRKEMEEKLYEIGEQACLDAGVHDLHPELARLLGKLKYRTSYGQNVLQHSVEVAHLAGLMAAELGLDANLAKRAGLLHDIGKALDKYTEGTHTQIGVEVAKKYGENPIVLNAIGGHHEDVEAVSPITVLVKAADAISGSRPGARRETLESYIKRLEKLEELAKSFEGVGQAYAIQAGREVRVIVQPEKVDDATAELLATDIAEKIQSEMEYPGQIKVTVIREFRAVDYAK